MPTDVQRTPNPLAEILNWFENPFPSPADLTPTVRVEDYVEDGEYVLHAEMPGVDPDRDISVRVHDGRLTIRGERHEEHRDRQHQEFRYGAFARTVTLPRDARADQVAATYLDGVLEIRIPMEPRADTSITVPVKRVEATAAPATGATTSPAATGATARPPGTGDGTTTASTDETKDDGDARPTR
jgi:HSP20 family protein